MNYFNGNVNVIHTRSVAAIIVLVAMCVTMIGGCNEESAPAAPAAAVPAAQTWEFDTPEAAVAHLQSLAAGRDFVGMYENMYARSDEEIWAKDKNRQIAQQRNDFAKILNVVFGTDVAPAVDADKDAKEFAAALNAAAIEPHGENRRIVRYPPVDFGPPAIVLAEIQGKWKVHVTSISDGAEIDLMWCAARQNQYGHIIDSYEKGKRGLRKGAFGSVEEAQRELSAMLDRPAPDQFQQDSFRGEE